MLKQIKFLITNKKINLDIYEQINQFIDSQENINQEDLIDIVEMMIDKIICNKGRDYQVIEDNNFWSPFKHLNSQNISYKNIELIKKFLQELNKFNNKQKIQLSKGFLFFCQHFLFFSPCIVLHREQEGLHPLCRLYKPRPNQPPLDIANRDCVI